MSQCQPVSEDISLHQSKGEGKPLDKAIHGDYQISKMESKIFISLATLLLQTTSSFSSDESCNCLNDGKCVTRDDGGTECQCQRYFTGPDCLTVDLHEVKHSVDEESISFIWQGDSVLLRNYSVVTHRVGTEEDELRAQSLPKNETDIIFVGGLRPERTRYILCILPTDEVENQTSKDLVKRMTKLKAMNAANCGHVLTAYDGYGPYASAAMGVVACMSTTLLLLVLCSAGHSCRDRERRERLMAEVMGKLEFFSAVAATKSSLQKSSSQPEESTHEIVSVEVVIDTPSSEEVTSHAPRASHLASLDSL